MRTTVIKQEQKKYSFPMTDSDVIERVNEVNAIRGQVADLDRKKKILSQEIKSIQTEMDQMMENISRREEEREVECDVVLDYNAKQVEVLHLGQILETRRMTDYEYQNRPEDIYPTIKNSPAPTKENNTDKTMLEVAFEEAEERAEEIKRKEENMVAQSANVREYTEAKSETSVIISAETLN